MLPLGVATIPGSGAVPSFADRSDTLRCVNVTLTTKGRRSGEPRTLPLYAWEDGDRLVVVGSKGGAAGDPDWVHNLCAAPCATVKQRRVVREFRAAEVEGTERDRLWSLVTEAFPMYASYQRKTKRLIPLFVLEPIEGA